MKIGYRRYTGPAWTNADRIRGARGQWLEKRIAFINELTRRGHEVTIIKSDVDSTMSELDTKTWDQFDLIFLEFASFNRFFHKDYLKDSEKMMRERPEDIILLLDDPDLYPKPEKGDAPFQFREVWANTTKPEACEEKWGQKMVAFPFYGLQKMQQPTEEYEKMVVYYGGTSCSREKKLRILLPLLGDAIEVYGAEKEFKTMTPLSPPKQEDRAAFYRRFAASIALNDNLHKELGWNTGRKFHSILSGTPAVDESDPDMGLTLQKCINSPQFREEMIINQQFLIPKAKEECMSNLDRIGL